MDAIAEKEIEAALFALGLGSGDTICVHSFLGAFGAFAGGMATVLRALRGVAGASGTLIMPTFNYDFCRGVRYDDTRSPSQVGQLTEYFRTSPGVARYFHPVYSHGVEGAAREYYLVGPSPSGFGKESFFGRLHRANAKLVYFGVGLTQAATFAHYVEEMLEVPYRFLKDFSGEVVREGRNSQYTIQIFSRYLDTEKPIELGLDPLQARLLETGLAKRVGLGRGFILAVDAESFFDESVRGYRKDPQFFLRHSIDLSRFSGKKR